MDPEKSRFREIIIDPTIEGFVVKDPGTGPGDPTISKEIVILFWRFWD